MTDLDWLEDLYQTPGQSKAFQDLGKLSELRYWKRIWTMQETVLAKILVLFCGARSISWISLCDIAFWRHLIHMRFSLFDLPEYIPLEDKQWLKSWRANYMIMETTLCKFVRSMCQEAHSQDLSEYEKGRRLKQRWLLNGFSTNRLATNPKDYIYALSGISGVRMPIDYSSHTPVAKVFQDYTAHWLETVEHAPAGPSEEIKKHLQP